jgi:hypothetical protein
MHIYKWLHIICTDICSTYYSYSSMFENCYISIIIYIYTFSFKCGVQPQLQHTGYLIPNTCMKTADKSILKQLNDKLLNTKGHCDPVTSKSIGGTKWSWYAKYEDCRSQGSYIRYWADKLFEIKAPCHLDLLPSDLKISMDYLIVMANHHYKYDDCGSKDS